MRAIVIGGGVMGLSCALALGRRGAEVRLLEAGRVGDGASGGVVGALTPHGPEGWRPMKAFQFAALVEMAEWIARLEAETGHATGYRRSGRVAALMTPGQRARAEQGVAAAAARWGDGWRLEVRDTVPGDLRHWLGTAPCGVAVDTLSAHVDPRALLAALATALADAVEERCPALSLGPGWVETPAGRSEADAIVLATGWQTGFLLAPLAGGWAGAPVKGQAAVLAARVDPSLPVLTGDGLYVVAHGAGRVAVGSTSEREFADTAPDAALDALVAKARALSPALEAAPVVERWAGLRPKPPGREPLAGAVPGQPGLWLATGGYKISFGIAHRIGEALAAAITGTPGPALPDAFSPEGRLGPGQAGT